MGALEHVADGFLRGQGLLLGLILWSVVVVVVLILFWGCRRLGNFWLTLAPVAVRAAGGPLDEFGSTSMEAVVVLIRVGGAVSLEGSFCD